MNGVTLHGSLRELREAGGVSLSLLAERLGVAVSILSRIERGVLKVPKDLPVRYIALVQEIALERAKAVGAIPTPLKDVEDDV